MQSAELKKIPATFCPAPFQSFVQDYNGQCGPCPYQAGAWDFKKVAFEDRWQSPEAESLRREHLNGVKSPVCNRCYVEEGSGFRSRRIAENEWKPESFERLKSGKAQAGLETMVLRLSNKCNYACRTCHSVDSSLFKKEGQYYADTYGDRGNRYIEREARAEFTAEQMMELCKLTSDLKELQFYGGEPMLNKTHLILLQHLIDQGRAPDVALFYCTNASIYPSEAQISLWKHFRAVHLHLSLDAVGDQYHYVRWPGNWKNVSANIQRWKNELAPQFGGRMSFGSNTTVSSINVYDIPEIYSCLAGLFGDKAALTTVHDPAYFSIIHLPREIKDKIAAKLQKSEHAQQFTGIVDFMNEREMEKDQFRDFVHWTEKMDAYRKVRFAEYFPEYYEALKPHYDTHAANALRKKQHWGADLKSSLATMGQAVSESASSLGESLKAATHWNKANSWDCSYARSQVVTDPRGRVKPCSRFQPGQKFIQKISKAPLEKILNSPDFRELRRQMDAGEAPAGCVKCQAEESAGILSLREKANRRNPLAPKPRTRVAAEGISSIELFLGSECNLKCRTCDHLHSSSIFQEEKNRGIIQDPPVETDLSVVKKLSPSLRSVKISGGEPFLMRQHLELLQLLLAEGKPAEISLSYNTNATVFPSDEVLELWKHFRKVTVAVSVDGVGRLNEYIRFPSQWQTVEQVTRQYVDLAARQENFHLSCLCTVSAYNLHDIADVMRWWKGMVTGSKRLSESSVTLNFVREPAIMAANVLPLPLKLKACEQLSVDFPEVAGRVRAFVLARDESHLLGKFQARTRQLDRIRGQSVAEAIPELGPAF